MSVYFVSGVDTDSGKTFVTSHLAAHLHSRGIRVITQKPVQTGCVGMAEDIEAHRKVMGTGLLPEDVEGRTCSYLFRKPASPHLSAMLEDAVIDVAKISADTAYLASRYQIVLVEGAGGLMVPLTEDLLTIDYVAQASLPLILVTTSKLGGINHAVLSLEACKHHGIDLRFVVFNRFPSDEPLMADDSLRQISRHAERLFPGVPVVDFRSSDSFWGLKF